MKKYLLLFPLVLSVAACSSKNDVAMNADYQRAVAQAETARMQAISEIAKQGETGAVAAAMMLANGPSSVHSAPNSGGDRALDWAGVVVPAVTTGLGIAVNGAVSARQSDNSRDVAINQSNNNADVRINTNETMADIAEVTIVRPDVVTSTNTTTTTTNVVCVSDATYTCE